LSAPRSTRATASDRAIEPPRRLPVRPRGRGRVGHHGPALDGAVPSRRGDHGDRLLAPRARSRRPARVRPVPAAAVPDRSARLARYAVPRYGALQVLFLEIVGGVVVLGVVLPLSGHTPLPPHTTGAWIYVLLLSLGSVLAANFLFFAAVKRIDAAPTAVAATI